MDVPASMALCERLSAGPTVRQPGIMGVFWVQQEAFSDIYLVLTDSGTLNIGLQTLKILAAFIPGWPSAPCVTEDALEFMILRSPFPESWDYGQMLSHLIYMILEMGFQGFGHPRPVCYQLGYRAGPG